jgi:hypothetical protein
MIYLSTNSTAPTNTADPLPDIESLTAPDPASGIDGVLSSITDSVSKEGEVENDENVKNAADALKEVLEQKASNLSADALNLLLKKKWDPFAPVVHHSKLKKLASNPVFLYIPCGSLNTHASKRFKNFVSMLGSLGKVTPNSVLNPYSWRSQL